MSLFHGSLGMDIFLGIALGAFFGIFTGLVPGVHTNLVVSVIVGLVGLGWFSSADFLVALIIVMAMMNTFVSVIPSVFIGVGEGSDSLSVLPGHMMLKEGRGVDAVHASLWGGVVACFVGLFFFSGSVWFITFVYEFIEEYIPWLLLGVSFFLVFRRLWLRSLFVYVCSGVAGWLVFESSVSNPLFPLLSGFFGVGMLFCNSDSSIPEQKECEGVDSRVLEDGVVGSFLGFFTAFLPGLGSGVAGTIGSVGRESDPSRFLAMTGGVDTANFFLGVAALIGIDRARNGAVVGVEAVSSSISATLLVGLCVVGGGLGVFCSLSLSRGARSVFELVDYTVLVWSVICFIFVMCLFISGLEGVVVLVYSSLVGWYSNRFEVSRTVMMACILLPVFFYLI